MRELLRLTFPVMQAGSARGGGVGMRQRALLQNLAEVLRGDESAREVVLCVHRSLHVANQGCAIRIDNEAGKGDHKHLDEIEAPYIFSNLDSLHADFWAEVNKHRRRK